MNTKKKKAVFSSVIALAAVITVLTIFIIHPVCLFGVKTAELRYEYGGVSVCTQLSEEDTKRLAEICRGAAINDFSIPACGFGTAQIEFHGSLGSTVLYPACDSCSTMRCGENDYYYSIGNDNRAELEKILAKYSVCFPCI